MRGNHHIRTSSLKTASQTHLSEKIGTKALRLDIWDSIEPAVLPFCEDTRASILHRISDQKWKDIKPNDLENLKAFVTEAQPQVPHLLSDEVIKSALIIPSGASELIQRAHPYALQVLQNPQEFTHNFRLHEGMYYYLTSAALLGRDLKRPKIVINWDPHNDDFDHNESKTSDRCLKNGTFITQGVGHYNWAGAAVRDALVTAVIRVDRAQTGWRAHVLQADPNKHRGVECREVTFPTPTTKSLLEGILNLFPNHQTHLTIDLDSFSSRGDRYYRGGFQFGISGELKPRLNEFFRTFRELNIIPPAVITADSRAYLFASKETRYQVDEDWILKARDTVRTVAVEQLYKSK